jgi:putative membrane protein insertion efficiency factor
VKDRNDLLGAATDSGAPGLHAAPVLANPVPASPVLASTKPKLSPIAQVLAALITGYRKFISPFLGARCRFYPSCSAYALEAIQVHGAGRGSWLAVRRLSKCHPFHPGGLDPVPTIKQGN